MTQHHDYCKDVDKLRVIMKNSGFTLIELMVTVAIVAILAFIAVPSFNSSIENNRMASGRNDLMSALQFARTEAVSRNLAVSICPSTDQLTCAAVTDWSTGWIIFEDSATGATPTVGTLLKVETAASGFTINFQSTGTKTTDDLFRFMPTGMMDAEFDSGVFEFCDPDSVATPRALVISPTTGMVRTGAESDASC